MDYLEKTQNKAFRYCVRSIRWRSFRDFLEFDNNDKVGQTYGRTNTRDACPTDVNDTEGAEIASYLPEKYKRGAPASAMIVDSQTVKSAEGGEQIFHALLARPHLLERLPTIFADGGYRGELVDWMKENLHVNLSIVLKEENQKGFQSLPERWVIERTNAWISRNRRLARDYER